MRFCGKIKEVALSWVKVIAGSVAVLVGLVRGFRPKTNKKDEIESRYYGVVHDAQREPRPISYAQSHP